MVVTYIHHSGFFVQQEKAAFLFDYIEGEIPEVFDRPLFVFVSHAHADHFSQIIFAYRRYWKNIKWILSDDISPQMIPTYLLDDVIVASPGNTYTVKQGDAEISFEVLRSTDQGNAYLISSEGKVIYHAGDLHLWLWREDPQWDERMRERFEEETEKLRGKKIDAAFLVLDPRQGSDAFYGLHSTMQKADIRRVYPMHCWDQYSIITDLIADPCSENYRDRICVIRKDGQTDEI